VIPIISTNFLEFYAVTPTIMNFLILIQVVLIVDLLLVDALTVLMILMAPQLLVLNVRQRTDTTVQE
jgi:hypothetical protein